MVKYLKYGLLIAALLLPQLANPQVLIRKEQIEDAFWKIIGNNDSEVTTNSGADADLITLASLSIPVDQPFMVIVSMHKTGGAAVGTQIGLKLNTTTVNAPLVWSAASDQADEGLAVWFIGAHNAAYLRPGVQIVTGGTGTATVGRFDADMPNATITDVTIRGSSQNGSVTLSVNFLRVYTMPDD